MKGRDGTDGIGAASSRRVAKPSMETMEERRSLRIGIFREEPEHKGKDHGTTNKQITYRQTFKHAGSILKRTPGGQISALSPIPRAAPFFNFILHPSSFSLSSRCSAD